MSKIFISYRRDDSAVITGRIYDHLIPPLGPFDPHQVFKDVDSIPLGVNFKKYLDQKVAECSLGLVVIGPRWLDIRDGDGKRRLDDPADFVRIEVEALLNRGIPVIPLLVMDGTVPSPDDLPTSLGKLAYQNGIVIRNDPDFRGDMARLVRSIEHWFDPNEVPNHTAVPIDTNNKETTFKGIVVTRAAVISALESFDSVYLDPNDYEGWLHKRSYHYAIKYHDRLYPPKHILRQVTEIPDFYGGPETNGVFLDLGFEIVSI